MNDSYLYKPIAIIVGNSEYQNYEALHNDKSDASEINDILEDMGYSTVLLLDKTKAEIQQEIDNVCKKNKDYNVVVFYYSGHGLEFDGRNYFPSIHIPRLTKDNYKDNIPEHSICLDDIIDKFDSAGFAIKIAILDTCRYNPTKIVDFDDSEFSFKKFAPIQKTSKGTLLAFATTSGEKAGAVGVSTQHSLYTEALLNHITEQIPIEECFKKVRADVYDNSTSTPKQLSWEHTALTTYFSFNFNKQSIDKSVDQIPETISTEKSSTSEVKSYQYEADAFWVSNGSAIAEIIEGLRTHNWYAQNDAMTKLATIIPQDIDNEHQFVLGRNILQTAIGREFSAMALFEHLSVWLHKWNNESGENHVLNGMLYEMYFDKTATFRGIGHFKSEYTDKIFALASTKDFTLSFDFIESKLSNYKNHLYFTPSNHMSNITIKIKATLKEKTLLEQFKEDYFEINELLLNEANILSQTDTFYHRKTYADLHDRIKRIICVDDKHLSLEVNDERIKEDYLISVGNLLIAPPCN